VLTQKPYLSSKVSVFDAILNLATPSLVSNPYCSFQIYQRHLARQPSILYTILNSVAPLLALNPYDLSQKY